MDKWENNFRTTVFKLAKYFYDRRDVTRGGSRTAATSKVDRFVIIINGWNPLTITTKSSTLDVAAVLDPSLVTTDLNLTTLPNNIKNTVACRS